MNNEIVVVQKGLITAYPPDYDDNAVSSGLWWDIRAVEEPHPEPPRSFNLAGVKEARRILDGGLNRLCEAAGPVVVMAWAKPLVVGITAGQPTQQEQADGRLALIVLALQDLAVGAFTRARQVEIARAETFAVTAAALFEVLGPRSMQLRRRQETLRYIASAQATAAPQEAQRVVPLRAPVQEPVLPEPTWEELNAERARQLHELGYGPDGKPLDGAA